MTWVCQVALVKVSVEIYEAMSSGHPVVALESTIISHGMPYPQNLETAKEVQAIVRKSGAVLATIAILDGTLCIGFYTLERLAQLGKSAQKTACRDIAHVGILVFVTGGIGEMHRHGEHIPIPKEHSASRSLIEYAIQRALTEAREKNITGNAETSFLLARVSELTGGASLASNIALVKNNAVLGAKLSVALAQLK